MKITVHGKTYKLPTKVTWNEGNPPKVGWYPTQNRTDRADQLPDAHCLQQLRFWNGVFWSSFVMPEENMKSVALNGKAKTYFHDTYWAKPWWQLKPNNHARRRPNAKKNPPAEASGVIVEFYKTT